MKSSLEELALGMQQEMQKQATNKASDTLVEASEYLHAALEIFEEAGLNSRADDVLKVLQKVGQKLRPVQEMPTIKALMEAGMTQRDLHEFTRGNPVAKAKMNLVLRNLGLSEHQIGKYIGPTNVMSEDEARAVADPNRSFSKMWDWVKNPEAPTDPNRVEPGHKIEFESIAQKHINDRHTKNLTPEKQVENLKNHGTQFNLADDFQVPSRPSKLTKDDMDADFTDLLNSPSFDIDASDDELMGIEIKEDSLEVADEQRTLSDFEDEVN